MSSVHHARADHMKPPLGPESNEPGGGVELGLAPSAKAPRGYTLEGKPRERAYRRYFGITPAGRVVEYPAYEAREIDARAGAVRRITALEVRELRRRERFRLPNPFTWKESEVPGKLEAEPAQQLGKPLDLPQDAPLTPEPGRKVLAEAKSLVGTAVQQLGGVVSMIQEIQERIEELEDKIEKGAK